MWRLWLINYFYLSKLSCFHESCLTPLQLIPLTHWYTTDISSDHKSNIKPSVIIFPEWKSLVFMLIIQSSARGNPVRKKIMINMMTCAWRKPHCQHRVNTEWDIINMTWDQVNTEWTLSEHRVNTESTKSQHWVNTKWDQVNTESTLSQHWVRQSQNQMRPSQHRVNTESTQSETVSTQNQHWVNTKSTPIETKSSQLESKSTLSLSRV